MIDLRFVLGFDFESAAIALFSAGHFSHVDARVPIGGVPNVPWKAGSLVGARSDKIGSKPPGLQCRPADYESVKRAVVFHLPVTALEEQSFWSFLYSQEGKAYDKVGIIAFVFNTNSHEMGNYFCSAAMADALESADWMQPLYSPYWKITPVALANTLSSHIGVTWEIEK
jgi:hypothetical protein